MHWRNSWCWASFSWRLSLAYSTALACAPAHRPPGGPLGWLQRWKGKLIGAIFISLGVRVAFQRQ